MKGLIFIWDSGWFHPQAELTLWHDLAISYNIDTLVMIPDLKIFDYQDLTFQKFETLEEALKALEGKGTFVFLEPKSTIEEHGYKGEDLKDFKHPTDAIYIFGNSGRSNIGSYNPERGDKIVYISTPVTTQIWSIEIAAMVLYDRELKGS